MEEKQEKRRFKIYYKGDLYIYKSRTNSELIVMCCETTDFRDKKTFKGVVVSDKNKENVVGNIRYFQIFDFEEYNEPITIQSIG